MTGAGLSTRGLWRAALFASATLAATPMAQAADGFDVLFPPPGLTSPLIFISGNGKVTVRDNRVGFDPALPLLETNGAVITLPDLGNGATPSAVNIDGSAIVGTAVAASQHAVMWTAGGTVITDLHSGAAFAPGGSLDGYTLSFGRGVSSDGSVAVGLAIGTGVQAFRWTQATGMVGLGFLAGYDGSIAYGVSGDGQTVVGTVMSTAAFSSQAAYWTQGGGWVGLGTFAGGTQSTANAISRDGSTIVGFSNDSSVTRSVFRWTHSGGMENLGSIAGGNYSTPNAVNADGSVIVGEANTTTNGMNVAMRWTRTGGMQALSSLLGAGGVRTGGISLRAATGVSDNGKIIVGYGPDASNENQYFIARCRSALCQGLVTAEDVMRSFAGQSAVGQTANAAIGGTLGTMQEYATQAMRSQGSRSTPYSVFGYGAYDSDPIASGTLGLTADLPFGLVAGFSASANYVKTDMIYNGNAKMSGGAVGAFVARVPDIGFQWLVGGSLINLKGDITRGYLNGITPVTSTGSTSGNGFGATARIGWGFALMPQVTVTPFASYTFAETRFGGYSETDGVFAARFDDFISTSHTSRVGGDARYTFAPNSWVWGTAAWGHRLDGGKGANITGTLVDAFALTAPGLSSAKDWAEVGGGVRLPVWNNGAVIASVTASLTPGQVVTYVSRLGVSQTF